MKKLIMTKGLPASGKSCWARKEAMISRIAGRKVEIINKDDIRKDLRKTGWEWSQKAEQDVTTMRDAMIKGAFNKGFEIVISSDTNFGKHEARLRQIAKDCNAEFEIKDFTHISVAECIERDELRPEGERVGPEVIKKMFNDYLAVQEVPVYKPDPYSSKAIICDLDGTIAIHNGRSPFDYMKCETDSVNQPVADIVKMFAASAYTILYVSGRESICREQTINWLRIKGLPLVGEQHKLFMRKERDNRKDNIVKLEIFDGYIRNHYNVSFVLDDRDQVVKMWRGLGLTCLQVAEGAF